MNIYDDILEQAVQQAYVNGYTACREAAAKIANNCHGEQWMASHDHQTCEQVANEIRALQPPAARTEEKS